MSLLFLPAGLFGIGFWSVSARRTSGEAKIVYVMNGWNRFKASRDFMEWFEGLAGDQTVVTLPQSEAFVQAGAAGVSVVQFDRRGKAARATRAMVDTVREAAGFPRE